MSEQMLKETRIYCFPKTKGSSQTQTRPSTGPTHVLETLALELPSEASPPVGIMRGQPAASDTIGHYIFKGQILEKGFKPENSQDAHSKHNVLSRKIANRGNPKY